MSDGLTIVAVSRPDSTWVHPYAGEIVARTFSDTDPYIPTEEDYAVSRRNDEPLFGVSKAIADFGSTIRYGSPSVQTWKTACEDSLAASRRRRNQPQPTKGDYAMRVGLVVILTAAVFITLILFGVVFE